MSTIWRLHEISDGGHADRELGKFGAEWSVCRAFPWSVWTWKPVKLMRPTDRISPPASDCTSSKGLSTPPE